MPTNLFPSIMLFCYSVIMKQVDIIRNSTDCIMLFAMSSWLSPLDGTNVSSAVCQLHYLDINCQAHGVAAASNQP